MCTLVHHANNKIVWDNKIKHEPLSQVESTYWISESSISVSGRGLKREHLNTQKIFQISEFTSVED